MSLKRDYVSFAIFVISTIYFVGSFLPLELAGDFVTIWWMLLVALIGAASYGSGRCALRKNLLGAFYLGGLALFFVLALLLAAPLTPADCFDMTQRYTLGTPVLLPLTPVLLKERPSLGSIVIWIAACMILGILFGSAIAAYLVRIGMIVVLLTIALAALGFWAGGEETFVDSYRFVAVMAGITIAIILTIPLTDMQCAELLQGKWRGLW